ncbi:SCP-like protein [Oesophagostomum dentatum]|uniref:SCP-like protein n=1 Tax=Oesophagostomum dentatum TaxID=61180 RepID=A0A0B1T6E2_OESDE|nr:SCP-like protein [Oesophagostomum dentatum]
MSDASDTCFQMASDLTTGLGCAVVHCGNRINVVCHYDTTLANAVKLYTCGPTCNRCENGTTSCVNGLCPAASETCSVATTTAVPEATTTTTEPNTLCPNNRGMTDPLRFAILAKHNSLRTALALGTVGNGQTGVMCRKASKMPTLTYSCNLECTALARASRCSQMDSTPPQCISENSYNFTKNSNRTLRQAANAATQVWWSELAALESGIDQIQNLFYNHLGISSFAKIASDLTTKIGCAVGHCNHLINGVCHYQTSVPKNQINSNLIVYVLPSVA